jgi:hypothetical protein
MLRTIFRRVGLGIKHRSLLPPLVLHAEGSHLRAHYRYDSLAVEYVETGSYHPFDSIRVPLDVLAEIEGRDDSPVVFEAMEPDRTDIRWHDHGIPKIRRCPVTPFGNIEPFSEAPTDWIVAPAGFLAALAEASEICTEEATRYALNCIQLRGSDQKIIATDGHQLLVSSGFDVPLDEDLLIRGSPIFACKTLNPEQSVQIGRTAGRVILRIGPWTLWNDIQRDVRFPSVEEAIHGADVVTTRLQLDPDDARFLVSSLDRLPGSDELNRPPTIDMNGKVASGPEDRSSHRSPRWCSTGPATAVRRSASTRTESS